MSNPSPQPPEPSAPARVDPVTETAARGTEGTVSHPMIAPNAGQPTVVGAREPSAPATGVPRQIGDYVVVKKIGEGGMGTVYLGEDIRLHRKAAIKTMRPELAGNPTDRDRFLREARLAATVEHDNVVPIWQIGEADGAPFTAMPFLQGEPLDARLKRVPVANLGVLLKVAREVSDGLAAAHAKGLIHRDIKPANIWLEGDLAAKEPAQQFRRCKILDFGLARSVSKEDIQITASGAVLGTPAYMAPEQARGEKIDHRADLFSLGVMLYRMATGKLPFNGPNAMAVLISLMTDTPSPSGTLNPNLVPALAELIDRLLSKDPAQRPQSAADVGATVRRIAKDIQAKRTALPAPSGSDVSTSHPVPVYTLPAPVPNPWEGVAEAETEALPLAKVPAVAKPNRARWWLVGGVLGLLALGAVLAAVILRVQTGEGTLVVEITDPDVEARIKNGKLVLVGPDGKDRYTITPAERNKTIGAGAYTIRVEGADGLALDTREFTLKKNGQVTVRVTLEPKTPPVPNDPKVIEPVWALLTPKQETGWSKIWEAYGPQDWKFQEGELFNANFNRGWIGTKREYTDFEIELEYRFSNKGNTGIFLRAWPEVESDGTRFVGGQFVEVQLIDDDAYKTAALNCTGAIFNRVKPDPRPTSKIGEWNTARVAVVGKRVTVTINGVKCVNADVDFPRVKGVIGLQQLESPVYFRNVRVRDLTTEKEVSDRNADQAAAKYAISLGGTVRINNKDRGIIAEKDLPAGKFRLTLVNLTANKKLTDDGLAAFKNCKNISYFSLDGTQIGDAGLVHLRGCDNLEDVDLKGTKVTAKGVDELAKALPECKIVWDGGTIEPTKK